MREHGLRDRARDLRREMTPTERRLWRAIRSDALRVTFRRQHAIPPYIADFACLELRLVVEVDGGQHGEVRDAERDATMRDAGWRVLRFWNNEVMENLDGVVSRIAEVIEARRSDPPTPALPRKRGQGYRIWPFVACTTLAIQRFARPPHPALSPRRGEREKNCGGCSHMRLPCKRGRE